MKATVFGNLQPVVDKLTPNNVNLEQKSKVSNDKSAYTSKVVFTTLNSARLSRAPTGNVDSSKLSPPVFGGRSNFPESQQK